jgi:hypothetical protein
VACLIPRAHFCLAAGSSFDLVFLPIDFIFVSCAKCTRLLGLFPR